MSESTVKVHISRIIAKLGLENRTQVAILVLRRRPGLMALQTGRPEFSALACAAGRIRAHWAPGKHRVRAVFSLGSMHDRNPASIR